MSQATLSLVRIKLITGCVPAVAIAALPARNEKKPVGEGI
jgi:hypothetical protein